LTTCGGPVWKPAGPRRQAKSILEDRPLADKRAGGLRRAQVAAMIEGCPVEPMPQLR